MAKIKGDRIKTFIFPVFDYWRIRVVSTNDFNKALKKFKHTRAFSELENTAAFNVHVENENLSYIFIHHKVELGTVAHEAYHAIERMLSLHDVEPRGEVIAYHLGYLIQEISNWQRSWK